MTLVTLKDAAAKRRISVYTVSRAYNNDPAISANFIRTGTPNAEGLPRGERCSAANCFVKTF